MIWPVICRYFVVLAAGYEWAYGVSFPAVISSVLVIAFFVSDVVHLRQSSDAV